MKVGLMVLQTVEMRVDLRAVMTADSMEKLLVEMKAD